MAGTSNPEASWNIYTGKYDGKDILIRSDEFYRKFKKKKEYRYQVGIAMPLTKPNETGIPSSEENLVLLDVEEKIVASFEEQGKAVFVAAISTNNMKELVFYTLDPEHIKKRFELLQQQIDSYELQLFIQDDKKWDVYKKLVK